MNTIEKIGRAIILLTILWFVLLGTAWLVLTLLQHL